MSELNLPANAFISPYGENKESVEQIMQQVLELLLSHLQSAANHPPLPDSTLSLDLVAIPDFPLPQEQILASIRTVLGNGMNAATPTFIGHMDSMPTTMSIIGEIISAAVNNNMLSLEMSPFLSRLETLLLQQFAVLFGLGDRAGGVLLSGGSLANLQALAVARNIKQLDRIDSAQPLVLFASEAAHTSLHKAAMLLGLGVDAVIPVQTNQNSQMAVDDLIDKIQRSKRANQFPFCVVATAGTTTTGNIDPLPEICRVARDHGLWFHVDAAYGGGLIMSDRRKKQLAGIEQADSLTFNPQKLLYIAKTCAMVLFRDAPQFVDAFRIQAPYMKDTEEFINLGEISVQGTRHAEVLKLWLSLLHIGKAGYSQLIDRNYTLTDYFVAQIEARSYLEMAGRPDTNVVCFRGKPDKVKPETVDDWNTALQKYLLEQGNTFLSLPLYRGARWLRAVLINPYLAETVIDNLFELVDTFANRER